MTTTHLPSPTADQAAAPSPRAWPAALIAPFTTITVEQFAYLLLGLIALLAHLWGLSERAMHHDETLHAYYSWNIFAGKGYMHDPLLHGPFLYHFGALLYLLFGDNDMTARLGVALFGTALTLAPYLIRRELGRPAALMAAVYLLISPCFLYMGRLLRHDMYSVLFEMLVFIGIVRYTTTHQARWLYLSAAAFGFMYVNQETSYLFLLIMAAPLTLLFLWRVYKPGIALLGFLVLALAILIFVLPGQAQVDGSHNAVRDEKGQMKFTPGPIFGWKPLETSDNGYALRVRNRSDNDGGRSLLENIGEYAKDLWKFVSHPALLSAKILSLLVLGSLIWLIWWHKGQDKLTAWQRARQAESPTSGGYHAVAAYASLAENWRWLFALSIFLTIYVLFFTAFLSNMLGIITGTTGSLLYWLAQHNVERGSQPNHYYLVLLSIYEPLPLFWAIIGTLSIGGVWFWRWLQTKQLKQPKLVPPRLPFVFFILVWWAIGAFVIYSWAGEKMPWLSIHVALPLVLLGAWSLQKTIENLSQGSEKQGQGKVAKTQTETEIKLLSLPNLVFGGAFATITGLSFVLLTVYFSANRPKDLPGLIVGLVLLALFAILFSAAGFSWGWRWASRTLLICFTLLGCLFTCRNAYRAAFLLGDTPQEMVIYTQTSPDVRRVIRQLEEISIQQTSRLDMSILYDNETVWLWYLRNFKNAVATGPQLSTPPADKVQAVLMLQENLDRDATTRENLRDFRVQKLPLRWWFPEDQIYRLQNKWTDEPLDNSSLLARLLRKPFEYETAKRLWQFQIYREPRSPLGSSDFVVAVRPTIANQLGLGMGAETK